MKCDSLRDAIVELARGGDCGAGTRAAVESHLEHCASCAALMTRGRQLSQGLRALAASTAAEAPSDALGRRLIEAFAERRSVPRARKGVPVRWIAAAAAVALMAATAALWRAAGREPVVDSLRQPPAVAADKPAPASGPGVALTAGPDGRRTTPDVVRSSRPRAARRRSVPAAPVVRATGFVSIPGADGLPDFESGEIVRIEIPFASLPTYGLEILPEASGTPVKADLLVGQDGQARAIRLVTTSALR